MMLRSIDGDGRVRMTSKAVAVAAVALLAALLSPAPALAQRMHGGAHWGGHAGGFNHFNGAGRFGGGHFGRFGHGHGRGHFGGALVIGGGFGLWASTVYPYPYYGYPYAYEPSVTYINMPPPTQVWYYCDAAGAYYPYVASCPGPWRAVPAVPPAPAQ